MCDQAEISAWATQQAELLSALQLRAENRYVAAINVARFSGNPLPIAMIRRNREIVRVDEVVADLLSGAVVHVPVEERDEGQPRIGAVMRQIGWSSWVGLSREELSFEGVVLEAWGRMAHSDNYHLIPTADNPAPFSFLACLEGACARLGVKLAIEFAANHLLAKYVGKPSEREGVQLGDEFRHLSLMLRAA
jgi:hypothetical protein